MCLQGGGSSKQGSFCAQEALKSSVCDSNPDGPSPSGRYKKIAKLLPSDKITGIVFLELADKGDLGDDIIQPLCPPPPMGPYILTSGKSAAESNPGASIQGRTHKEGEIRQPNNPNKPLET